MEIGPEHEAVEYPVPAHPDEILPEPVPAPEPEPEPAQPEKVPA
jgi:hypothetical protein